MNKLVYCTNLLLVVLKCYGSTILFIMNYLYFWPRRNGKAPLLPSESGAFRPKKHRFFHRKAPLLCPYFVNILIHKWLWN